MVVSLLSSGNNAGFQEQPYLSNVERLRKAATRLPGEWATRRGDPSATEELLALVRDKRTDDACQLALDQLADGNAGAAAVWDAVHLAAGELIMRERDVWGNLAGVHAVTSANALHYAFRMSGQAQTRLLILLQAVGWMARFGPRIGPGGKDVKITRLTPGQVPASEEAAARDLLAALTYKATPDQTLATVAAEGAPKAIRYAQLFPESQAFLREARRIICLKSSDEHHYKYSAAIFEDYRLVDPRWRPHLLAAATYYIPNGPDSPLALQARAALGVK